MGFKSLNDFSTIAHAQDLFDLYQLLYIFYFLSNNNNTNNPKL